MTNRRIAALRGWMPVAVFSLVGAASIAVLEIHHQLALATLNRTVAAVDNLTHARLTTMEAYLSSEQIEAGDPTFGPSHAVAELARAADLVDDLREGRTSLLVVRRGAPLRDETLIAASQRYGEAIAALQARLRSGTAVDPAERRIAFSRIEDAAAHLEHELYNSLRERLANEGRRHRIWMAGWSGFLFVTALGLLALRRGQRRADEAREHAERSRARSEAHFRSLIENAPDLIFLLSPDGILQYESPSVERGLGYGTGELIGRDYFERVHPDDRRAAREAFENVLRAPGGSLSARYRYRQKNGELRVLESTATNLTAHPAVQAVVLNTRDVTDRVRAMEDLRESERRHLTLLQAVPDLIFRQTRAGELLDLQAPEGARYLDVPLEEARGRNLYDILPPEVAQASLTHTTRALASGGIQRFEYTLPMTEGARSFEARLVPSGPDEVLTLVRDVTEQKRLQLREGELLREQAIRAEAEAANRAKNEFLSRMSHELRTPLNAILGFGQLLEMEAEEDQESVDQILRAGKHLLALIDEVLDIARIEAGHMSLSLEPVSVRSVLQESVDLVRLTAAKQGITLRTRDALASEHFVGTDKQRLKQVLLNLLSNAIKYNRPEGTVTLACEELGEDRLRISVRDTGYGIAAEKLERLFTPFDRLGADQSTVEGTGLGLALSKGLMDAMGGRLGVESVEGEGSRFWVELPIVPRPALVEPAAAERPEVDTPGGTGASIRTVLVVEDNLANVRLMERVFRRRPQVRLVTAMQGSLGLELAREHRPDLILLDLNLPDISGEKVLLQVRQDTALWTVPVVMISGDAIPTQIQRMLDLGAQGYITKPFDVSELLRLVDEHLQQEAG